jgi:hypothetical protein
MTLVNQDLVPTWSRLGAGCPEKRLLTFGPKNPASGPRGGYSPSVQNFHGLVYRIRILSSAQKYFFVIIRPSQL